MIDLRAYFRSVVEQSPRLGDFFSEDAEIVWPSTGEHFGVEDYVKVNCAYPGHWTGEIVKVLQGDPLVLIAKVAVLDGTYSTHVVSLLSLREDKIARLEEYWSEDGDVPDWRKELLGTFVPKGV
ncbi:MAG: nuclear transport factor 2 family protein [Clostridia bacterium]|nr:nuclear transport factor 2 family protein [Clostridia bacterium]